MKFEVFQERIRLTSENEAERFQLEWLAREAKSENLLHEQQRQWDIQTLTLIVEKKQT